MELVIAVGAVAFILALLDAYLDIRRFKAVVALVASLLVSLPILSWYDVVKIMSVSFFATFLVALADRVTTIPLTISRALGQQR